MLPGHARPSRRKPPRVSWTYDEVESNLGLRLLTAIRAGAVGTFAMDAVLYRSIAAAVEPTDRSTGSSRRGSKPGRTFRRPGSSAKMCYSDYGATSRPQSGPGRCRIRFIGHWRGLEYSAGPRCAPTQARRLDVGSGDRFDRLAFQLCSSALRQDLQANLGLRRQNAGGRLQRPSCLRSDDRHSLRRRYEARSW